MNELVRRLSEGSHPVEITLRPATTMQALKECIDRQYVHIKFTDTKGGTELGVKLDIEATDMTGADFANQKGSIKFLGDLTLDYVRVRCVADVDLATFAGFGHIEPIGETSISEIREKLRTERGRSK